MKALISVVAISMFASVGFAQTDVKAKRCDPYILRTMAFGTQITEIRQGCETDNTLYRSIALALKVSRSHEVQIEVDSRNYGKERQRIERSIVNLTEPGLSAAQGRFLRKNVYPYLKMALSAQSVDETNALLKAATVQLEAMLIE